MLSKDLADIFVEILQLMRVKCTLVICGFEGLDEILPEGQAHVWKLDKRLKLGYFLVQPSDFRLQIHPEQLKSGTPPKNAALLLKTLDGKISEGSSVLDFLLLNTAALLVCMEKVKDWKEGVSIARESIRSGDARKALDGFVKGSTEVADAVSRLKGS